jgi:excinuclease ABC subunit B
MKRIRKLEAEMYRHARELEFERAAELRDEIERLREEGLGLPSHLAG